MVLKLEQKLTSEIVGVDYHLERIWTQGEGFWVHFWEIIRIKVSL